MQRFFAIAFFFLALSCVLAAIATAINLGFILTRPDSISVVNTLVGQFVVIVAALVLAKLLYDAGRSRF